MFSCLPLTRAKILPVLALTASVAVGAAIWPGAQALAQGNAFQSGSWAGSAYGNTEGKFERCVITSEFPGKPVLGFGRELTGKFEIWLVNPEWAYTAGANELVTLSIDGSPPKTGNFLAIGPDRIATQLPPDSPLIDGLSHQPQAPPQGARQRRPQDKAHRAGSCLHRQRPQQDRSCWWQLPSHLITLGASALWSEPSSGFGGPSRDPLGVFLMSTSRRHAC